MRAIILADMNAFFASVHQAVDPSLRGKPVIVAGDPRLRHGIILTASYEAKKRGIKTGMGVWQARALCPDGIFIQPDFKLYFHFSSRVLKIMRDFTPLVEPFSVDEAFMDITGSQKLFGTPVEIARALKERICRELGLTCSVGVAPNKLLAKMAAGMEKPDGLTLLGPEQVPEKMWPLPVEELFGVGGRYRQHLNRLNIRTIGDLAHYPVHLLKRKYGLYGEVLWLSANGLDSSPVDPDSLKRAKSIGQQITLPRDYRGEEIRRVIRELADLVAYRVRTHGYAGNTVQLTLRDTNLDWLSRMKKLSSRTDLAAEIAGAALELFQQHWFPETPVRLVGIALSGLLPHRVEQPTLFREREKVQLMERACDQVRNRYGKGSILRAASLIGGRLEYVR